MEKKMKKTLFVFSLLFALFAFSFHNTNASQNFPVFVTINNLGSYYQYTFDDTLLVDEVGIRFNDTMKVITSTNRSIPLAQFNFTSTLFLPVSGYYSTESVIPPDIKIKAATEMIIVYLGQPHRLLLPTVLR